MSRLPVAFLPVGDAYDRWAPSYDKMDNPLTFAAARVIGLSLADVRGHDAVELGCGTGRNLAALAALGARSITGCDLSDGMLARARERSGAFRLLRCDMTLPLPLPDRSADLVLFCLSLEHVAELEAPLSAARRLMRRLGWITVIEIHPFLASLGAKAHFEESGAEVHMPTFPHRFADYLNAFAASGLRVEICREWRPRDFGADLPEKALKRGPDVPLLVEFCLVAA